MAGDGSSCRLVKSSYSHTAAWECLISYFTIIRPPSPDFYDRIINCVRPCDGFLKNCSTLCLQDLGLLTQAASLIYPDFLWVENGNPRYSHLRLVENCREKWFTFCTWRRGTGRQGRWIVSNLHNSSFSLTPLSHWHWDFLSICCDSH